MKKSEVSPSAGATLGKLSEGQVSYLESKCKAEQALSVWEVPNIAISARYRHWH